jgi:hypothetical protein
LVTSANFGHTKVVAAADTGTCVSTFNCSNTRVDNDTKSCGTSCIL